MMQSEIGDEFDRATEPPESGEESYYYEEAEKGQVESDGSEEGFYMPTLIHKSKTNLPKKKKKKQTSPKAFKKPPTKGPMRSPDSARGGSEGIQPLVLQNSRMKSQTLSGNDSREMVNVNAKQPYNNNNSMQGNILGQFTSTFSN